MSNLDWVLAEFVRIYHGVSPQKTQGIIERIVARKAPAVEDFNGFLKVLRPKLQVSDYALLTLFEAGKAGATYQQIEAWVQPKMRANLRRALDRLVNNQATVHFNSGSYFITKLGIAEVEAKGLHR